MYVQEVRYHRWGDCSRVDVNPGACSTIGIYYHGLVGLPFMAGYLPHSKNIFWKLLKGSRSAALAWLETLVIGGSDDLQHLAWDVVFRESSSWLLQSTYPYQKSNQSTHDWFSQSIPQVLVDLVVLGALLTWSCRALGQLGHLEHWSI